MLEPEAAANPADAARTRWMDANPGAPVHQDGSPGAKAIESLSLSWQTNVNRQRMGTWSEAVAPDGATYGRWIAGPDAPFVYYGTPPAGLMDEEAQKARSKRFASIRETGFEHSRPASYMGAEAIAKWEEDSAPITDDEREAVAQGTVLGRNGR